MPSIPKPLKPRDEPPLDGVALLTRWASFHCSADNWPLEMADDVTEPTWLRFRLNSARLPKRTLTGIDPSTLPLL